MSRNAKPREGESEAGANDESFGTREPQGKDQSFPTNYRKTASFGQAIKTLFREAIKALMHRAPATPRTRRRRTEDTGQAAFTRAAGKIMQPATRQQPVIAAASFMWDTLAWLHLWEGNDAASTYETYYEDQHSGHDHLSLHL
jgi:hypothetical protein